MKGKKETQNKEHTEETANGFILPSNDAIEEGRKAALAAEERSTLRPMEVQGLDYSEWISGVIDLDLSPKMVNFWRNAFKTKGFVRLEGKPIVNGCSKAEVWIQKLEDHKQRLEDRRQRHAREVRAGTRYAPMGR